MSKIKELQDIFESIAESIDLVSSICVVKLKNPKRISFPASVMKVISMEVKSSCHVVCIYEDASNPVFIMTMSAPLIGDSEIVVYGVII